MEPEWFYKPIEGYNRRYIRVGEFRKIRWCEVHYLSCDRRINGTWLDECAGGDQDCRIVDKWLEV